MLRKPDKVWLVLGHRPTREPREYPYSTDPRHYDLPDFTPMSDAEYARVRESVKVFIEADHAVDFCYGCGLETTMCFGYRLVEGAYRRDRKVTDEVTDTDW